VEEQVGGQQFWAEQQEDSPREANQVSCVFSDMVGLRMSYHALRCINEPPRQRFTSLARSQTKRLDILNQV
jgi:hypothetical protein